MLQGALAYLECRLQSAQEAGDHTIFIAEVEDVVVREGDPLLFFRGKYRQVGPRSEHNSRRRVTFQPLEHPIKAE